VLAARFPSAVLNVLGNLGPSKFSSRIFESSSDLSLRDYGYPIMNGTVVNIYTVAFGDPLRKTKMLEVIRLSTAHTFRAASQA
jgi:hypothetical protein